MKRLFTLLLLLPFGALSAQAQSSAPPQSLAAPQPARDSLPVYTLHHELMAQITRDLQQQLLAKLDARNGFRDVTFGTHLKYFKKVVLESKEDDDRNYRRVTDQLSINGMPLTEIVYGFYKERLHHIYLTSPGVENSRQLLKFFQAIYGPGERVYEETEAFDNMIQWTGKKVVLTYAEVATKKEGFFHFFMIDHETPTIPKPGQKKGSPPTSTEKKVLSSNKSLRPAGR